MPGEVERERGGRGRRRLRAARPLFGYSEIGAPGARHSPAQIRRAWLILAVMIVLYLAVMLTIYLLEPGLR
jgi:hypothetical protein